jgi:DNA-directed RNA polymerase subunit RPC12/RpoP
MEFPCPTCHQQLTAADAHAGRKVACPHCGQRIKLPAPESIRRTGAIGYLIVAFRVPIGSFASVVLTLSFLGWLVLETIVALMTFPWAAVLANQAWVRGSWLGRFPIALRTFSRDRFAPLRDLWRWVTDPMEAVDL